jgi:hypothetical protein
MKAHAVIAHATLEEILSADQWARTCASELMNKPRETLSTPA